MMLLRRLDKPALASFVGRKLPHLSRIFLRIAGPVLPNLWFFHFLVLETGVKVVTGARLGNGMQVRVFLGDMIGCHIWHSGWYESDLVNAITPFLQPDMCFFDVGAHIGQYTLLAADLVKEVHTFEASSETFAILSWNVRHNRLANVHVNRVAVSDREGEATMLESSPHNIGQTSFRAKRNEDTLPDFINMISLDHYARNSNLQIQPRKAFIKIDVEGAELFVLEGARELMRLKPVLLLEAIDEMQRNFGRSLAELVAFLRGQGYVLRSVTEKGLAAYDENYPNVLALPAE